MILAPNMENQDEDMFELKGENGKTLLSLHIENGMINSTKLCQTFKRNYGNFRRTRIYKQRKADLSVSCPDDKLELIDPRGGSWISPLLLSCLSDYLTDDLAFAITVEDALLRNAVKNLDYATQVERLTQQVNELTLQVDEMTQQIANLEKQIKDSQYDTEIEVTRATFDIECENERIMKENEELKRKCTEAQRKYDEEISYKHHWNKYIREYKTVYEYARDMYKIDMSEATFKKVDKIVAKKQKERYAQAAIHHKLYTQLEKYSLLVSSVRPLNAEMIKPPEPKQPSHFKKVTPRAMHTYHKRDWDLIDGLLDMYKDEPAYL